MKLLRAMGYGGQFGEGRVTNYSHDGGIDGVINEDKLGLDVVCVQRNAGRVRSVDRRYSDSSEAWISCLNWLVFDLHECFRLRTLGTCYCSVLAFRWKSQIATGNSATSTFQASQ